MELRDGPASLMPLGLAADRGIARTAISLTRHGGLGAALRTERFGDGWVSQMETNGGEDRHWMMRGPSTSRPEDVRYRRAADQLCEMMLVDEFHPQNGAGGSHVVASKPPQAGTDACS